MIRLLYLCVILVGLGFWHYPANDPDLGWHLFGGAWISANAQLPSEDIINTFNPYWHNYHWLGQLLLFKLYALGDYTALRYGLGFIMACLCKVLLDIILISMGKRKSPVIALLYFCASIYLIDVVTSIRPQIFAVLLLALALRRLIQKPTSWELPYLFLLCCIAVNIHVYWIFIPFLWGLYRCLPRLLPKRAPGAAYAWGGLALLCASGLVSPYGLIPVGHQSPYIFVNYELIYEYLHMAPELRSRISELSRTLGSEGLASWLWVAYLLAAARIFRLKRVLADAGSFLAALVSVVLSLSGIKYISLFAVTGLPYLVRHSNKALSKRLPSFFPGTAANSTSVVLQRILLSAALVAALVRALVYFPAWHDNDYIISEYVPIEACDAMAELGLQPQMQREHVRVLTHFNHGGWCRWALYQTNPQTDYRVTTDGRTQGVPHQHYLDSFDLYRFRKNWAATLQNWTPDVALVHKDHALAQFMVRAAPAWQLVHQDDVFAVFVPKRTADYLEKPAANE